MGKNSWCIKHGMANKHPLYFLWKNVTGRCYSKSSSRYQWYGERGVKMCDEWKNDFKKFFDWAISNGYKKGLQLDKDKLSPTKPGMMYSPEYCCFLTGLENAKYKSNSRMIEHDGETKSLSDWSEVLGFDYHLIHKRINKCGWDFEKAITTPSRFRGKKKTKTGIL